jgi:hypothetical protein
MIALQKEIAGQGLKWFDQGAGEAVIAKHTFSVDDKRNSSAELQLKTMTEQLATARATEQDMKTLSETVKTLLNGLNTLGIGYGVN